MNQNDFVFHGAQGKGLKIIQPTSEPARADKNRPLVFASRYKSMASCFLLDCEEEWARVFYTQNGLIYFVTDDMNHVQKIDKGGSLYVLFAEGFVSNGDKGMQYMEWMSDEPQKVAAEFPYRTAVKAMQMNGVKVMQVSKHIFENLRQQLGSEIFQLLSDEEMEKMRAFLDTHERKLAA